MAIPRHRNDRVGDHRPVAFRDTPGSVPRRKRVPRNKGGRGLSPKSFVVLAVVPLALMLGSVYLHATAAGLEGESARLADEKARAEAEAGRLEAEIAELSRPERIRSIAEGDLGMRDPAGEDLRVFDGGNGEGAVQDVEEDE